MSVLVVEGDDQQKLSAVSRALDNSFLHDTFSQISRVRGQILRCSCLDKAFELFSTQHPDIVIINLSSFSSESFDLCQKIRFHESERHTAILFYQGDQELGHLSAAHCLEVGGDDFIDKHACEREIRARVHSLYRFKLMTDELRSANHQLKQLSLTDELTGLHNMRSFNSEYAKILFECSNEKLGFAIIMIDLDHFKQINDHTNHLVGSYVISEVGRILSTLQSEGDLSVMARYGGDEYVGAIVGNSLNEVWSKVEYIKDTIGKSVFKKDEYSVSVTPSIGLAWIEAGFDGKSDDPIKAADMMLYRSKRLGRNQIQGMVLRYPVDFDHIGRTHLIDRDSSSDDDSITRIYDI